jgi:MFS family permease
MSSASSTGRSSSDRSERDEDVTTRTDRRSVVHRQKEEHGGVKIGSAFFGFLTATGVGVLLTALAAAAGAAVGLASGTRPGAASSAAEKSASTVGIVSGIVLLVILLIAYYCGGYVAGRMARFNGMKQGIAVWLWALVIAIVVGILTAVAGSKYNVLAQLNSFPRIPVSEGDLTTGGIVAAIATVVVTLGGAILGGLAGMRFHRKVDRTGLDV